MSHVRRADPAVMVQEVAPSLRKQMQAAGDLVASLVQVPAANDDVESIAFDVRAMCRQRVLLQQGEYRRAQRRARLEYSGVRAPHVHPSDDTANITAPDPDATALAPILRAIKQVRSQIESAKALDLVSVAELNALHAQLTHLEAAAALMQYRRQDHTPKF